jgi:hypothetical protein
MSWKSIQWGAEFSGKIFEKFSNIKISWKSVQWGAEFSGKFSKNFQISKFHENPSSRGAEFSGKVFEKLSNIKISWKSVQRGDRIFWKNFRKILKYQNLMKIHPVGGPNFPTRTAGQNDRHDKANSLFFETLRTRLKMDTQIKTTKHKPSCICQYTSLLPTLYYHPYCQSVLPI